MVNFYDILKEYVDVFAPDYRLITETPSGINIDADDNGLQKLIWLNVIENGTLESRMQGLNTMITRNIQIVLFSNCIKEDDGLNYQILKEDIMNDGILLFDYLSDKFDISSVNYDTGVDELDQNMVGFEMSFVFEEKLQKCDYFESVKNKGLGLSYYNTFWKDEDNYKLSRIEDYIPNFEGKDDPLFSYAAYLWNIEYIKDEEGAIIDTKYTFKVDDKWLIENLLLFKVCEESTISLGNTFPLFIVPNNINIDIDEIILGGRTARTKYKKGNCVFDPELEPDYLDRFVGTNYTLIYWNYVKYRETHENFGNLNVRLSSTGAETTYPMRNHPSEYIFKRV